MMNLYTVLRQKNVLLIVFHIKKISALKFRKIFLNSLKKRKFSDLIFLNVMFPILLKLLALNLIYIDKKNKNWDIHMKKDKLFSAYLILIGLYWKSMMVCYNVLITHRNILSGLKNISLNVNLILDSNNLNIMNVKMKKHFKILGSKILRHILIILLENSFHMQLVMLN